MRKIILMLLLAGAPLQAMADVTGGSNIALTDYPGPDCTKPQAPVSPGEVPGRDATETQLRAYSMHVTKFNNAVADYNVAKAAFNTCITAYVEKGNSDMHRIKEKLDAVIAAANAP